ncbi:beta-lactamase family protein [Proteobacteria bacterium 005FR1]|nr:beta-lactamase family protein [Proteobacteria bacterium 005FR1]
MVKNAFCCRLPFSSLSLHFRLLCCWLMITLVTFTAAASAQEDARQEAGRDLEGFETYLDGVMTAQFNDWKLAGMTFALVRDGKLALSKGYGLASVESGRPVDPATTLFRPGSVSKLFTWTAVMQLVEQGKIDLDAPVSKYVHQFDLPEAFGAPLTMTHILTHSPGLEDGGLGFLFQDEAGDLVPLEESLAAHIPTQVREPGSYSAYSNWATALAGLVVANVSGMSFEDYVRTNILEPIDMRYASFEEPLPENLAEHMAQGYTSRYGGIVPLGFEFIGNFGPAGSLSASAEAMANFIIAHVNEGAYQETRILEPDTVKLMHSRLFGHDPRVAGMAHGFYEIFLNGERFVGHGGDTIAFHSLLLIHPETGFGFFLSFNTPEGARARAAVAAAIIDWFFPETRGVLPAEPAEVLAGSQERIAKVVGAYRLNRRSFTQLEGVSALAADVTVAPAGDGQITVPSATGGALFNEVEPWVFRQQLRQDKLVFETDDEGNVTHAFIDASPVMVLDKLTFWEMASTHQLIMVLALLAALFVLINAIRNHGKISVGGGAKWARRSLILASASFIAFALGIGFVIAAAQVEQIIFDFPPPGTAVVLALALLGSLFTLGSLAGLIPVWRSGDCNAWQRIRYSYVTGIFMLLVLVLAYWNLLGWNY